MTQKDQRRNRHAQHRRSSSDRRRRAYPLVVASFRYLSQVRGFPAISRVEALQERCGHDSLVDVFDPAWRNATRCMFIVEDDDIQIDGIDQTSIMKQIDEAPGDSRIRRIIRICQPFSQVGFRHAVADVQGLQPDKDVVRSQRWRRGRDMHRACLG